MTLCNELGLVVCLSGLTTDFHRLLLAICHAIQRCQVLSVGCLIN